MDSDRDLRGRRALPAVGFGSQASFTGRESEVMTATEVAGLLRIPTSTVSSWRAAVCSPRAG